MIYEICSFLFFSILIPSILLLFQVNVGGRKLFNIFQKPFYLFIILKELLLSDIIRNIWMIYHLHFMFQFWDGGRFKCANYKGMGIILLIFFFCHSFYVKGIEENFYHFPHTSSIISHPRVFFFIHLSYLLND